jgi:hypothetical protein
VKTRLLFIILCCHLSGCGAGLQSYSHPEELFSEGQTLWKVRIDRGDSQLFAGLLALNKKDAVLEAVLLDSTGIKLLQEKILATGALEVVSALPAVRNKRLAPFLGEGLFRLFFIPDRVTDGPCHREGLFALCFGVDDQGQLVKFRRLGPFVLWSADYFINGYDAAPVLTGARLNSGWLTPSLQLEKSGDYLAE